MKSRIHNLVAFSLLSVALAPTSALASVITLNRDAVVPIVFDSALTLSDSRVGDLFTCHVEGDRDIPNGTRFEGRIVAIRIPRRERPASMDLEFTSILLPGGGSARIHAIPIPLNKDLVRTDDNGRLYVKNDVRKQGEYVIGGALGGYLIGSLFHRRTTGLFLGTVAGIIAASQDSAKSENTVVDRGAKMGALFNQDATIEISTRGRGGWDSRPDTNSGAPAPSGNTGWDGAHRSTDSGRGWDSSKPHKEAQPTPPTAPTPAPVQAPPQPPADISVRYADKTLSFSPDAAPYFEGELVMVPLEQMSNLLGVTFELGEKNSVYIESQDVSIKLEQDSATYRVNGKRTSLSHPVVLKNNVLFAPVTIFGQLASKDLIVNGNKVDSKG